VTITLDIPDLTYYDACRVLGALNYELRAAQAISWSLPNREATILRRRCSRLRVLVPVAEAMVTATTPYRELPLSTPNQEPSTP
jgi:hypothetical protein